MRPLTVAIITVAVGMTSASYAQTQQDSISIPQKSYMDSLNLEDVVVVAQKPLVKMETDKMTYDVQQDADAKSFTLLDILRKVPMVTVDGQDNITVNGSSSFKVYVDNKPNPMFSNNPSQVFKSIPASMVKNIEVITNPGARYDAEGTGGILNIILNKQTTNAQQVTNGYNGNVSVGINNRGLRSSAFISGQQGKLTYSVNGIYAYMKMNGTDISFEREQTDGSTILYHQDSKMNQPFAMGNMSMGYEIDSISTLSASLGMTSFKQKLNGHPTTTMSGGAYGTGFSYGNSMKQNTGKTSFNGNIDYQRFFNPRKTSYMILSYLFNSNPSYTDDRRLYDDTSEVVGLTLNDLLTKNHLRGTEHTLQADFTHALSSTQKLNYGAKYINRLNKSDSKYYDINEEGMETLNAANSLEYKNTQNILAGYAEWRGSFGKLTSVAGARYEHTWEKMNYADNRSEDFQKDYGVLVPSASLSYNLQPTMNIGINYTMRIVRPGITYLNPYIDRSAPTSLTYGNPDLDVEKKHNVKLVYNYFSHTFMLNTTLGYQYCDNRIEQYSFLDADNLLNSTYGNIVKNQATSLNLFANWLMFPKTRLMMNTSISYTDLSSHTLGMNNHGWGYTSFISLEQTLPWDLRWGIGGIFMGKTYTLQGYTSGMSLFYTDLSKTLIKDKLDLSLNLMTPFSDKLELITQTKGRDYTQRMNVQVPIRQFGLTLTYKFGNSKKQFQQKKSNITNDFQEQKSNMEGLGNIGTN